MISPEGPSVIYTEGAQCKNLTVGLENLATPLQVRFKEAYNTCRELYFGFPIPLNSSFMG